MTSLIKEHGFWSEGFSSCGTWAWLPHGKGDLPRPGSEPVSPALADELLATGPPGKSPLLLLLILRFSVLDLVTGNPLLLSLCPFHKSILFLELIFIF